MQPLPELTPENTAFWQGGEHGELRITFCGDCEFAIHPPQLICPKCWSRNVAPRTVPGTGTVYSFTVNYQPWLPGMQVPFALAVVDIDGAPGVRFTARVLTENPESVHIGQRLRAQFQQIEDVWLPLWAPLGGDAA